jgi:hypothetical protein
MIVILRRGNVNDKLISDNDKPISTRFSRTNIREADPGGLGACPQRKLQATLGFIDHYIIRVIKGYHERFLRTTRLLRCST